MVSLEVQLVLPDNLAQEAEAQGLLRSEAIESLLRAELRRRQVDQLFDAVDRLAALPDPLTADEVDAEIQTARDEKRRNRANSS